MVYLFVGKKRSGKTCYCVSYLRKHSKKYSNYFCNFPLDFAYKIDPYTWMDFKYPKNSAIFIDEAQKFYNSRNFTELQKKGIGDKLLDFLTLCSHYDIDIFFITQSPNRIDLQIRELADVIFHIKHTFKTLFRKEPFLVFGYNFSDITDYEKFINPNNFSHQYNYRFTFKFIYSSDLKTFDTKYIYPDYLRKPNINFKRWSEIK